jgi:hypothetical protein
MADDSKNGSEKDRNAPTVRDLAPRVTPKDTLPDVIGEYVPPRPLPGVSEHRTLDLRSVRVSPEFDPRRAPTELRLESPPRKQSSGRWLVAGVVVLLGIAVLLVVRAFAPSSGPASAPAASPSPAAPNVEAPTARAAAPAAPTPTVAASVSPSRSESVSPREPPPPRAEAPAAPSAAPKAPASREPEKKRREPWLE